MSNTEAQSDLNEGNLKDWLSSILGEKSDSLVVSKFDQGQSNPTYRLTFAGKDYVLRRKPFGKLLPSAHAVDREYKILSALAPVGYKVPTPIALCKDENVLGIDFYLMEFLDGRVFGHLHMPNSNPTERRDVNLNLMQALSELHRVDYKQAGLGDFERPGNYYERQVKRWSKQYRATETEEIAAVEFLLDYLPSSIPEQTGTCIIHGDYSLKNVMFEKERSRALAVLDWELTTIGDPLADLTYCTMYWVMPPEDPFSLSNIDHKETGIPTISEMQERYALEADLGYLPNLDWHYAFNLFRLVGIFQGIKKRMIDGNASGSQASEIAKLIPALAERAQKIAGRLER